MRTAAFDSRNHLWWITRVPGINSNNIAPFLCHRAPRHRLTRFLLLLTPTSAAPLAQAQSIPVLTGPMTTWC